MRTVTVVIAAVLVLSSSFMVTNLSAQKTCSTKDQAVGFATEKSLDDFIDQAESDPGGLKKLLDDLMSKKQAFVLKGGEKVKVLERKKGDDPEMDKVKAQSTKDNRTLWVPGGALDCR